jgi:omega-6 fatty acid desaturase (delta-12 desaturase)
MLQRAHDENPIFHEAPVMTIRKGVRALGLTLYDEQQRHMIRFKDLRRAKR